MASNLVRLYNGLPRCCSLYLKSIVPRFYCEGNRVLSLQVDALDDFTQQLMQRKVGKWYLKNKKHILALDDSKQTTVVEKQVVQSLNMDQLNSLFQNVIEQNCSKAITDLVQQCIIHNKVPSLSVLIHGLAICSHAGNKEGVLLVRKLCEKTRPDVLQSNSNFDHFMAEAIWVKGDIFKSLDLFEKVYYENAFLRRRIRLMLKHLVVDLVANKSEGALWHLIAFSEKLAKDYKDFFPLTCVWQACFLSEWYTDQCIAVELLERNEELCKSIVSRIHYVVYVSLKCHRTEVVYRLVEIMLKYGMKQQSSLVLLSLLDYQCKFGFCNNAYLT